MKKAISVWSFPPNWSLEQTFTVAKEAGFEGIELDFASSGPVSLRSTEKQLFRIRGLADKHRIDLIGLATGLYWKYNPVSHDPAIREHASKILKHQVESAATLGIDSILIVPGVVGGDSTSSDDVVPYDVAYRRAETFLSIALPRAETHQVALCIENVWNKFLLSPLEMQGFIDAFKSPYIAAYFDVGNTLATGYPEHWISILGARIRRVHLKDYRRAVGTEEGFVELLSGDTNWPAVVSSLRDIDYNGWLTAEMIPPQPFYRHSPETLIHNTARAIDAILLLGT